MRCYNRFDNGTYLLTCLEQDGHEGSHRDESGETWEAKDGWFDQYGEKKRSEAECQPPRVVQAPAETPETKPDVSTAVLLNGCFNCRQGNHDKCVFNAKHCLCRAREHKPTLPICPTTLKTCQAAWSDGECNHPDCPQKRDGEPAKTGRTCPLPWGSRDGEDTED